MPGDKLRWCERLVHLDRRPIRFDGRPYLPEIYRSTARNLVLRCSRQVEKSTFLANTLLYEVCVNPGIKILFVAPRLDQARVFSHSRLLPPLEQSPLIRRALLGRSQRRPPVMNLHFANGSILYIRAAFRSADAVRGISADILMVDEFQDMAPGDLPVLQETLSHSGVGKTILTGTPKTIDNHLEGAFNRSTANEWTIHCASCQHYVNLDERVLGAAGPICPHCQATINPLHGAWVPRNPQATWGAGFGVNHLMVSWVNYVDVLERQRVYDPPLFKNEVLGLPTVLGDHVVTREELEACCTTRPMVRARTGIPASARNKLIAGIDWGGGGTSRTVVVVGFMDRDYRFQILYLERHAATEEPAAVLAAVANTCTQLGVRWIAADGGGNGHVYNRLLLDRLPRRLPLVAFHYAATDHPPQSEGVLTRWTINRSASIGGVFARVKKRSLLFPRMEESGSFLDEFAAEYAEYDDIARSIKYCHPDTQPDDALHATTYALRLGVYTFSDERPALEDCS